MQDYKATLNLPQTDFPMKAGLAQKEPARLSKWQSGDLYQKIRDLREGAEKFVFIDGPPYANGKIHLGHALNKILKDIVVKSQTINGKDVVFIPTWDCHGLPIELNVEKKHGKVGHKIDATTYRQKCREYAQKQVDIQKEDFKRLGVLADWDNPILTMDYHYEANIIRLIGKIFDKGHIVRGFKPVHWCLDCGSSLAEAEVEYQDKVSPAIDVKFAAADQAKVAAEFGSDTKLPISAVIWTTTPWTLPANQAIAVGDEVEYVLVDTGSEAIILAKELVEKVCERAGIESHAILGSCHGASLEGVTFQHPFDDRQVPVVIGHHVTTEDGTGMVHTAPAHGVEDFIVGKKYDLPMQNPVANNGCFIEGTPLVSGLFVRKADGIILEYLREHNCLLVESKIEHSYPHCWRHNTPLIFRATSQWFISMKEGGLQKEAMKAIPDVNWIPKTGEARINSMIGDRPDWCISRQRTWGTPLALFLHNETQELHPDTVKIMGDVADAVEKGGIDAWFDNPHAFCPDKAYEPISDTIDVWLDSGASNFCILEQQDRMSFPADLYLEGSDQHRGWFQSSLLTSIARTGKAPFKEVLTHGFTVDEHGFKMSKSKGNGVEPQEVMKTLGADILRLWVAGADYRYDMTVSDQVFKQASDTYRRLRNTAKFLLSNLAGFEPEQNLVEFKDMLGLDQWVMVRAAELQAEIIEAYNKYQFHQVVKKVHYFCSIELGGFYLDVIKDRQYTCQADSRARRSAQTAMFHIVKALAIWMAPVLSFTADEIWGFIPGSADTVFTQNWHDFGIQGENAVFAEEVKSLMIVRDEVNKHIERLRGENKLGSSLEAEVTLYADASWLKTLAPFANELKFGLITSSAELKSLDKADEDALDTDEAGLKVSVVTSDYDKCERCWHRCEDVNANSEYPMICGRCVSNIAGDGEVREVV